MKEENVSSDGLPRIIQVDRETGTIIDVPDDKKYTPGDEAKLSVGMVVPRETRQGLKYLKNARDYEFDSEENMQEIIKMCNTIYFKEGPLSEAIDLFVDYGQTEMSIEGVKKGSKEEAVCLYFIEHVNENNNNMEAGLDSLVSELLLEYWIAGNVFPYIYKTKMKSKELGTKSMRNKTLLMPNDIYLIDPYYIEIPSLPVAFGEKEFYLRIDENIARERTTSFANIDDISKNMIFESLPSELKQLYDKEKNAIKIPSDSIYHIKRKGRGYQTWGVPFLFKAFNALARKKKIQALDESTIDGIVNSITVFKIGLKDEEDRTTWDPARLRAFSRLLSQPNANNLLVWPPDVEVLTVSPDASLLDFDRKYDQVDKSILQSINIPSSLLSGDSQGNQGSSGENVWVQVSALLEKVEVARNQVKKYIEKVMYQMILDNNLDKSVRPKIKFKKPNLRNEKEYRDFVIALYDRGILPTETTVKEAGYDWEETKERRSNELTEKINGKGYDEVFTRRDLPFSSPNGAPDGSPNGKGRPEKKDEKKKVKVDKVDNTIKE